MKIGMTNAPTLLTLQKLPLQARRGVTALAMRLVCHSAMGGMPTHSASVGKALEPFAGPTHITVLNVAHVLHLYFASCFENISHSNEKLILPKIISI